MLGDTTGKKCERQAERTHLVRFSETCPHPLERLSELTSRPDTLGAEKETTGAMNCAELLQLKSQSWISANPLLAQGMR